jgi:amino acid transporter
MAITYAVAAALVAISLLAVATGGEVRLGSVDAASSLPAAAVSIYLFLGFTRVVTLGEEAMDYKRGIPRAMPIGVVLLGIVFLLTSIAVFERVPYGELMSTVVPQILLGQYLLPSYYGGLALALVSIMMSFTAFNAGILGTSRLLYALGREGILPRALGRIEGRHFTPYVSLLLLYALAITVTTLVYLTRNFAVPILVASAYESITHSVISYSALWHRRRMSGGATFRVRWGSYVFAVTAAAFASLSILLLATSPIEVTLVLAIGLLATYIYVRARVRGLI